MRVRSAGPGPALLPKPDAGAGTAGPRRPKTFTEVLDERVGAAPAGQAAPRPPAVGPSPPSAAPAPTPSPVRALLEQTIGTERRIETLLAAAARGKTFSPGELLALQATVFRYSQAVEIVSRATDKLVGAVKQTMATQV